MSLQLAPLTLLAPNFIFFGGPMTRPANNALEQKVQLTWVTAASQPTAPDFLLHLEQQWGISTSHFHLLVFAALIIVALNLIRSCTRSSVFHIRAQLLNDLIFLLTMSLVAVLIQFTFSEITQMISHISCAFRELRLWQTYFDFKKKKCQ